MHVYVADAQERERLRREWGSSATAIRLHMHVVDLPLLVHDAPLPRCSRHISRALAFSVPDLANLYREQAPLQPTPPSPRGCRLTNAWQTRSSTWWCR